jgi:hypothetical protein
MARTRCKPAAKKDTTKETIPETPASTLPPSVANPPRLFILPKDTSSDARIVTLSHPATATPTRYFFCPEKGFYEFTKIATPKSSTRSWLLAPQRVAKKETDTKSSALENAERDSDEAATGARNDDEDTASIDRGYITKHADLFIATPIDPLFLLLPALAPRSTAKDAQKQLFLSLDDHLDTLTTSSPHLKQLLRDSRLKDRIAKRMGAVTDVVDAGDEKMYRLSLPKLAAVLLKKAERMAANGLPASIEEKFVRDALVMPLMNLDIPREDSGVDVDSQDSTATPTESQTTTTMDSQTTATSETTETTSVAETTPTLAPINAPEGIPRLLRLRTALSLLLSLLHPSLHAAIHSSLPALSPPVDFTPLTMHLSHLATLRHKSAALRSVSDNISRKRAADDDADEVAEMRAEKKRKKEEEEQRKKRESRGVKGLRKVDVSGMRKMSSFFAVKPGVKK